MSEQQSIQDILNTLSAEILALDPADKDEIVRLGSSVESLLEELDQMPAGTESLLMLTLEAMQGVYEESLADTAAALEGIAAALGCVAEHTKDESERRKGPSVEEATELLRGVLGSPAEEAAEPQDTPVAESQEQATPAESEDAPVEAAAEQTVEAEEAPEAEPEETSEAVAEQSAPVEATEAEPQAAPAKPAAASGSSFTTPAILPADTDLDLLKEFIIECLDHITAGEASLLDLEVNPDDGELINTIFRAFHTIKGTSGFLGLDRIQKLAHLAENLLNRGRDGEITIRGGYADLALKSCDTLRMMIEGLKTAEPGGPLDVPEDLEELLTELSDPEAHGISDESQSDGMRLGDILVGQEAASREDVEQAVQNQGAKKLGQAVVESGAAATGDVVKALRTQKKLEGTDSDSTIRVGTSRLDNLINVVGELVIAQSMVAQDNTVARTADLSRKVNHTDKIVRELQDLAMSLRMVPLRGTFQKMTRLVRDLGRKSGKSVRFVSEGDDTEIDRSMVEVLNDPLVHMIRNSVDHGLESAEERTAAGKDPTGTVTLRAYHAAGKVVIELCDDGRGLNKEKILAKATERGLVTGGRDMADSEIFGLIFQPGFSTADKVTDISGRGVGMDVVRKGIDSLRGQIEVSSQPGEGSVFSLRLPLTMAISDSMLIRVGDEKYLLPTTSIEHSFRPVSGDVSTVVGRGEMVQLRGRLLPVLRLHRLFNITNATTDPEKALLIIMESHSKRCALMVDELLGQQQVVIKSLGQTLGNVPGVAGGAILGDGRVGLILDPTTIADISHRQGDHPGSAAA